MGIGVLPGWAGGGNGYADWGGKGLRRLGEGEAGDALGADEVGVVESEAGVGDVVADPVAHVLSSGAERDHQAGSGSGIESVSANASQAEPIGRVESVAPIVNVNAGRSIIVLSGTASLIGKQTRSIDEGVDVRNAG